MTHSHSSSLAPALGVSDIAALEAMSDAGLEAHLVQRAEAAWRLAQSLHPALPHPAIWFDLRGRSAGQAHLQRGGLRFNRTLLRENRQAFMDEIVPHEMAHWLVFHLENGTRARPHGREWQAVMRQLYGLAPVVTHRFDVSRASPMPYRYRCRCETPHYFTARRHAQARRGSHYRCRRCRGRLIFERLEARA
ncbi:SprT family zinc-dependent metalloprotease [Salinicola avicenniae]|uniref:SprT family zinc-dependent metalloprotease n=1 Tax=Salinicola avicenniae TaxID=2916836 RepID=UPI002072D16E|nr:MULTISPECIES: SprT-like domain-containing protein [unclassified Salinicola]